METPDQFPTVPYASFTDLVGPVINSEFLNRIQEGFQDVIGALWGRSAALLRDEYIEKTYAAGKFGSFDIDISSNVTVARFTPNVAGVMGAWGVTATAPGAVAWIASDNDNYIGNFDFTVALKVRVNKRAELDAVAIPGYGEGLKDNFAGATNCLLVAGGDVPNWHIMLDGVVSDLGVPVVDNRWYEGQICRKNGTLTVYMDGTLCFTGPYATVLTQTSRYQQLTMPAATLGNGYQIDYFHAILMR